MDELWTNEMEADTIIHSLVLEMDTFGQAIILPSIFITFHEYSYLWLGNQDPFLGHLDLLRIYSFLSRKSWSSIVISWSITYILYTHIANFQTLLCDSSDFLEEKKIRILAAQGDRTKFLCKFISGWDIPLWILEKTKKSSFLSILFSIDLTTICFSFSRLERKKHKIFSFVLK